MNELRVPDLFDLDPFPATLRDLWRPWRNEAATERAPQIRIDLSETDNAFTIKAEIPGVKKEDIDVRIDGNQVTISAEVKQDSEEKKDGRVLRSERRYGYRQPQLPARQRRRPGRRRCEIQQRRARAEAAEESPIGRQATDCGLT